MPFNVITTVISTAMSIVDDLLRVAEDAFAYVVGYCQHTASPTPVPALPPACPSAKTTASATSSASIKPRGSTTTTVSAATDGITIESILAFSRSIAGSAIAVVHCTTKAVCVLALNTLTSSLFSACVAIAVVFCAAAVVCVLALNTLVCVGSRFIQLTTPTSWSTPTPALQTPPPSLSPLGRTTPAPLQTSSNPTLGPSPTTTAISSIANATASTRSSTIHAGANSTASEASSASSVSSTTSTTSTSNAARSQSQTPLLLETPATTASSPPATRPTPRPWAGVADAGTPIAAWSSFIPDAEFFERRHQERLMELTEFDQQAERVRYSRDTRLDAMRAARDIEEAATRGLDDPPHDDPPLYACCCGYCPNDTAVYARCAAATILRRMRQLNRIGRATSSLTSESVQRQYACFRRASCVFSPVRR